MKFTLSWLKEHLDTEADAQTIADKLTSIGLEVESIEDRGARLKNFIVAEILSAEKHPQADRLRVCMVDAGESAPLQIVCGAPNARAGIKVVLARPGTIIPASGEALKVGIIRGVESRGMLCSGSELLLGGAPEGILELPLESAVGSFAANALGLIDPVIEVSITPNRGDAASVYGLARDLAASGLGRLKVEKPWAVVGTFRWAKTISLDFSPENTDACPIFAGRLIRNVKNGPSLQWVQDRLKSVGLKPISALVDATNLIAQDRGRPLHVFDADRLSGNLHARMATAGEEILALDGKTYRLDEDTIVIADDVAARGIAGIMGGEDSSVSLETKNIVIELAWFDPVRIARSGRKLGIMSDARYRFERGVDPQFVMPGLELCSRLILEWCGGEPSDVVVAGDVPPPQKPIRFDPTSVERLGGIRVDHTEIISILMGLGFAIVPGDTLEVTPPSWRRDIDGPADLVEEVVRIHGLAEVPSVALARIAGVAKPVLTNAQRRARAVRRSLASRGFNECVSFSFIARGDARLFGGGDDVRQLANPIASDLDALRPSLLPSLLRAVTRNAARGLSELRLFEIGATFQSGMPGAQTTNSAGIIAGDGARDWLKSGHRADVFDAKAAMLAALEAAMGGPMNAPITAGAPGWFHPGRSGTIQLGPKRIGWFGELHPKILASFDVKVPCAGFEIILDAIPEPRGKTKARAQFSPSPYQAIERDFAFVLDQSVEAQSVIKAALAAIKKSPLVSLDRVDIFDVYDGKGIPAGQKSLGLTIVLQPLVKTLTDLEIESLGSELVGAVSKATGGSLRT